MEVAGGKVSDHRFVSVDLELIDRMAWGWVDEMTGRGWKL